MTTTFQQLPIEQLVLSQTRAQVERRAHFDKRSLTELAESIRAVGILQPIVARPIATEAAIPTFEIVAGERRFMAAEQLGLADVPVNVRELDDNQVLEVQLVENLQREGLHELAEAEGYEALMKLGRSAEQIADKVGRSKGYVYARMKLLALVPEARRAYYDGKLNASTALLIARIPVEAQQRQALKDITTPNYTGEAMSYRQAARHIQDTYMLRLASAGFKTEDETLVPSAGACGPCPKRTGNAPELFGDVKGADVCTDLACFKAKLAAHNARVRANAEASGQKIISGKDAKKVAPWGTESSLTGYVRLDERDYSRPKSVTYRQVLGRDYVPALLEDPKSGRLIEVAPRADLPKEKTSSSADDDSWRARQRAEQKKRETELAARQAMFLAIHAAPTGSDLTSLLRAAAKEFFSALGADGQQLLAKALGWAVPKEKYSRHIEPDPFVDPMNQAELHRFLRDLTIAGELSYFSHGTNTKTPLMDAAAAAAGVDLKKIRAKVIADAKAREKARKAKKSKGKK